MQRICLSLLLGLVVVGVAEAQRTKSYNLTVSVNGPGSVVSEPPGIDCGTACAAKYNAGTQITLLATADTDANFMGWGGACSGTSTSCTIDAISGNTAVTATFSSGGGSPAPYSPVVVNVACDGTGTKLQDTLYALNPSANSYEVLITGNCPEELVLRFFNHIILRSADSNNHALIGRVSIQSNVHTAVIRDLTIVNSLADIRAINAEGASQGFSGIKLVCAAEDVDGKCRGVAIRGGKSYLRNIYFEGDNWRSKNLYLNRAEASVYTVDSDYQFDYTTCLSFESITANFGTYASVNQGSNCAHLALNLYVRSDVDIYLNVGSMASANADFYSTVGVHDLAYNLGAPTIRDFSDMISGSSCNHYSVILSPDGIDQPCQ